MQINNKGKKIIAGGLLGMAFVLAAFWLYLHSYYVNSFPKVPQIALGRIVPLNVHGTIVYLTERESSELTWLSVGAMACGICGGALWKKASH
jgi:hypothetical protein